MNYSFYEARSKEKLDDAMKEGLMSQAHYRSRSSKAGILSRLYKLIIVVLVIWGLIQLLL